MLSSLPKPAIIAHRGASSYAPENTLAAFKLALQQGADGIELDAKLSADGQVVVFHDQTVDRTTPCQGRVKDFTLAELRKMDAGSHFDIAFCGESIPTLDEVFKAVGPLTFINIELKKFGVFNNPLPEKVIQLIRKYRLSQRVLLSSFNILSIIRIHRLSPEIPIGLLALTGKARFFAGAIMGRLIGYDSFHIAINDATPEMINEIHRRECRVFVYTVDQERDMQRLFEMGVDGIFTKDPILARQVLTLVKS